MFWWRLRLSAGRQGSGCDPPAEREIINRGLTRWVTVSRVIPAARAAVSEQSLCCWRWPSGVSLWRAALAGTSSRSSKTSASPRPWTRTTSRTTTRRAEPNQNRKAGRRLPLSLMCKGNDSPFPLANQPDRVSPTDETEDRSLRKLFLLTSILTACLSD